LRERQTTAEIPVIFMTARAQTRELAQFLSLGAAGVIAKPFDPMTLAGAVRSFVHRSPAAFDELKRKFVARARSDALVLAALHDRIRSEPEATHAQIDRVAHALLGAAGVHGFAAVGAAAQDLVRAVENARNGIGSAIDAEEAVDRLIAAIASDCRSAPAG
jgi:CheY-like chemotaxis protein